VGDDLRIFISYRRKDTRGYFGWLSSALEAAIPKGRVFRDVESIGMGDWKRSIDEGLRLSDVVLCVIGDRWLSITHEGGDQRRLDDPEDMVRWEVARSLSFKAERSCVAQVLLDDVPPPDKSSLPEDIRRLFDMQAYRLRYEDWAGNVANLLDDIRRIPFRRPGKLKGSEILTRWNEGHDCPDWIGCQGGESVFRSLKEGDWLNRAFEVQFGGSKKNNNWFHVRVLAAAAPGDTEGTGSPVSPE
jgi:hypothetical protein